MHKIIPAILATLLLTTSAQAQRDLKVIPDTDPQVQLDSFQVADGWEVNLFASDPDIASPIQMNFDEEGRLWVASSEVYPQIEPGQTANDKIIVLEDTNGDGTADKSTIFADGLLIPTGVLPGDGGVYVANSTELLHIRDTNGDGIGDQRRVVLSGFGTEDTHHIIHTFRWGHDGMMYFNQSIYIHSHVETPYGVKRLNGGGIWQFRPETMELDILCKGFVNTWGHHWNQWGANFATDGAYSHGVNYVFPGSVFVSSPGARRILQGLNPGNPKHCGLEVLSGGHIPDDWQGNMITNDFRAHRVCRFIIEESGSGYAGRQAEELMKTAHGSFRPVDVKMGPDGAIYIADWYNPIIQHGEVDFRDPRRDKVHGRIWRLTKKDRPLVENPNFAAASVDDLLEMLKANEQWVRLHAKLQLKTRDQKEVLAKLASFVEKLTANESENAHTLVEALWAYQTINQPNEALLAKVLASPEPNARAAALRVAGRWQADLENKRDYFTAGVKDSHARVRLEAVRALAEVPEAKSMEIALAVLDQPMDEWLDFALWQLATDLAPYWIPAVRAGALADAPEGQPTLDAKAKPAHWAFAFESVDSPELAEVAIHILPANDESTAARLLQIAAQRGSPQRLGELFETVLPGGRYADDPGQQARILKSLAGALETRKTRPEGDLDRVRQLFASENPTVLAAAIDAAAVWGIDAAADIRGIATRAEASPEVRIAAIGALGKLKGSDNQKALVQLVESADLAKPLRLAALENLTAIDQNLAAKHVVALLQNTPAGMQAGEILAPHLAREGGQKPVAEALAGAELSRDQAQLALRAARASTRPAEALIEAIQTAGGLSAGVRMWSDEQMKQITELASTQGEAKIGEQIFRREELGCYKCHAIGSAGGQVGPNMISLGASSQMDYIVESLLRPDAKIKEGYHGINVLTDDGKVHTGIPVRETGNSLILRNAEDQEISIPLDQIEDRAQARSLMPDGSIDSLTTDEIVHLSAFLGSLGKGEYAIGSERVVRGWQTLTWTREANSRLNRTSHDTAATLDPALTWKPIYSLVSGQVPVSELAPYEPHRGQPKHGYLRAEFKVTTPGKFRFELNNADHLLLWNNEKPIAPQTTLDLEWPEGTHRITIGVNLDQRSEGVKLKLVEEDSTGRLEMLGDN